MEGSLFLTQGGLRSEVHANHSQPGLPPQGG